MNNLGSLLSCTLILISCHDLIILMNGPNPYGNRRLPVVVLPLLFGGQMPPAPCQWRRMGWRRGGSLLTEASSASGVWPIHLFLCPYGSKMEHLWMLREWGGWCRGRGGSAKGCYLWTRPQGAESVQSATECYSIYRTNWILGLGTEKQGNCKNSKVLQGPLG